MAVSEGGKIARLAHGPSLVGIFMNILLYGVMAMQSYIYFSTYKRDPKWMNIYVATLFLADTLNTVFNMAWIYNVLINNFQNLDVLAKADWLFGTQEAMAGIIAMLVQLFFAWRILVLTRNIWVVACVIASSVVAGLSGIGTAIAVSMHPEFSGLQHLRAIVIPWLVGSAVCDIIITVALSRHLRLNRTGFAEIDTVLNRIIMMTISNGMLTAAFALADVIAYLATPLGIHLAFNYTLVKLYTNSVMSSLNSRPSRRGTDMSAGTSSHKNTPRTHAISNFVSTDRSIRPQVIVNVETHEMVDVVDRPVKRDAEWSDSRKSSHLSSTAGPGV